MISEDKLSKGVLFGVPTLGRPVHPDWALATKSIGPPINYNAQIMRISGQEIAIARNGFAQAAMDNNCEYLFLVGDDTQAPAHALMQLIYRMEHDPELGVVGGVYCAKADPTFPLVFRGNGGGAYWDWSIGEYFWVTGIGMDCTLIRTEVFRDLEPPYFKTIREVGSLDGNASAESWTEDLWFCDRVRKETNWKIYADSMVMCLHWNLERLFPPKWKAYQLRTDSKPYLRAEAYSEEFKDGVKQIVDLGCGPVHYDFHGEGRVTRVDIRDECEPDWRGDVRRLPFDADTYDVVFSSHTLEHFARAEISDIIKEWTRILKPGGELRLIVPSIEWAAQRIVAGHVDWHVLNVLYGSQEYKENFHRVGFTPKTLEETVRKHDIEEIEVTLQGYNILLRGKKKCRAESSIPT